MNFPSPRCVYFESVIQASGPVEMSDGTKKYKIVVLEGPEKNRRFFVREELVHLGRDPSCRIHLEGDVVASKHLVFRATNDHVKAVASEDVTPPVLRNGEMITEAILKHGDVLEIGPLRLQFQELRTTEFCGRRRNAPVQFLATAGVALVVLIQLGVITGLWVADIERMPKLPALDTEVPSETDDEALSGEPVADHQAPESDRELLAARVSEPVPSPGREEVFGVDTPGNGEEVQVEEEQLAPDPLARALEAAQRGEIGEAERVVREELERLPGNVMAYVALAKIQEQKGEFEAALATWDIISDRSIDVELLGSISEQRIRLGELIYARREVVERVKPAAEPPETDTVPDVMLTGVDEVAEESVAEYVTDVSFADLPPPGPGTPAAIDVVIAEKPEPLVDRIVKREEAVPASPPVPSEVVEVTLEQEPGPPPVVEVVTSEETGPEAEFESPAASAAVMKAEPEPRSVVDVAMAVPRVIVRRGKPEPPPGKSAVNEPVPRTRRTSTESGTRGANVASRGAAENPVITVTSEKKIPGFPFEFAVKSEPRMNPSRFEVTGIKGQRLMHREDDQHEEIRTIQVMIKGRKSAGRVDASLLDIDVQFFDRDEDSGTIVPSRITSAKYDAGVEPWPPDQVHTMTRLYQVPNGMRKREFDDTGRRLGFYGVVVKVRYDGVLQHEESVPPSLLIKSRELL